MCVYGGQIVKDGHEIGFCLCVVYVDDILLLSTTKEAEEHVVATLSSVVPVKTTGEIGEEGGIPDLYWSCYQERERFL